MSMEHSGVPIRLEIKNEKEILQEKISKLRSAVTGLGVTVAALVAALAIHSDLGKKLVGNQEGDELVFENLDGTKYNPNKLVLEHLDGTKFNPNGTTFSYTLQDVYGLLEDLDKKVLLGQVSDEQMGTLRMILEKDAEYDTYLKNLDKVNEGGGYDIHFQNSNGVNEDGGTRESGYVPGSEQTDKELNKNK